MTEHTQHMGNTGMSAALQMAHAKNSILVLRNLSDDISVKTSVFLGESALGKIPCLTKKIPIGSTFLAALPQKRCN